MGITYEGNRRYPFRGRRDAYVEAVSKCEFVAYYDDRKVCSFTYFGHALRCLRDKERSKRASKGHDRG